MKNSTIALLSGLFLFAGAAPAQTTVATDPVGFVSTTVPANSDAVLAVPLNRAAEFKGTIQSISGSVITVAGSPGWTTNQFVQSLPSQTKTYAVQIATGAKEGMIGKVTANASGAITVQLDSGDDLTGIGTVDVPVDPDGAGPLGTQADQIDVMPYWTPASLITGVTIPQGTQILVFSSGTGINLSSSGSFGYDAGNWYDEDTFDVGDHNPLRFGSAFVLRNAGSALAISIAGSVPMNKHRLRLSIPGSTDQDLMIGFTSPVPQAIGTVALGFTEDDQLLVFNNAASGRNKSASQVLYYTSADGWVDDSFNPVDTTFFLQPGQGYVFRKKASAPTTLVWSALQTYLQ